MDKIPRLCYACFSAPWVLRLCYLWSIFSPLNLPWIWLSASRRFPLRRWQPYGWSCSWQDWGAPSLHSPCRFTWLSFVPSWCWKVLPRCSFWRQDCVDLCTERFEFDCCPAAFSYFCSDLISTLTEGNLCCVRSENRQSSVSSASLTCCCVFAVRGMLCWSYPETAEGCRSYFRFWTVRATRLMLGRCSDFCYLLAKAACCGERWCSDCWSYWSST